MANTSTITLGNNDAGRRLDRVVRKAFPSLPLGRIYAAIRAGEIRVNGKRADGATRVAAGDTLSLADRLAREAAPASPAARVPGGPPRIALSPGRIVLETPHLLIVAKERGELVHGPGSLEEAVRALKAPERAKGVSFAPGPVHRLDRNTSGLVVFATSLEGAQQMSAALLNRTIAKRYVAVLAGTLAEPGRWDDPLVRDRAKRRSHRSPDGQSALTLVTPVAVAGGASLVLAKIVTGRSHQIRAHAAAHGVPLLGDRKYGGPPFRGGYVLHAGSLTMPAGPVPVLDADHVWTPLPASAEARVGRLFGDSAVRRLYDLLSVPDRD